MSVITSEELNRLRVWVTGLTETELTDYLRLAERQHPSGCSDDRQMWFRLGRLLREERERRHGDRPMDDDERLDGIGPVDHRDE